MTLQVISETSDSRFRPVEVVRFFELHERVFFVHHQDEDVPYFGVADLRTGFRVVLFADSADEAMRYAQYQLREKNTKVKFANYEREYNNLIKQNIADFTALNLVERDGFFVCPCAMECLDDATFCRHLLRGQTEY